jgi:hypothetical protein
MMTGEKVKQKRTCSYERYGLPFCSRTQRKGDEYCIFHSEDIDGKRDKFDEEFKKEFKRQKEQEEKYDFTGFVFPDDILFEEIEFEKDVSFWKAQFSGGVIFESTQFSGKVRFGRSTFSGVKLTGLFASLINRGIKRIAKGRYKIKDFRFHLSESIAEKYPVIERMTKDAWYLDDFKNNHPFIHALWNIMAKCGQSIGRWALWSLFFALYFAFNFYLIDYAFPHAFHFNPAIRSKSIWSFIYYSIVTFTTLGFGDIIPTLVWVQRWVMAEVIMGYIMLGGLISILANKLARRS